MSAAWVGAWAAVASVLLVVLTKVWQIANVLGQMSQWMSDHDRWHTRESSTRQRHFDSR